MITAVERAKLKNTNHDAWRKWRYYVKEAKKTKDPLIHTLRKVYHEVHQGRTVVDIGAVLRNGGLKDNGLPNLAFSHISAAECYVQRPETSADYLRYRKTHKFGQLWLELRNIFPDCGQKRNGWSYTGISPVPFIPPHLLEKTKKYSHSDWYVLWEVKTWTKVAPEDPYLLRKLSGNMFVIEGEWDVTDIERACIQGKMY